MHHLVPVNIIAGENSNEQIQGTYVVELLADARQAFLVTVIPSGVLMVPGGLETVELRLRRAGRIWAKNAAKALSLEVIKVT